MFDLESGYLGFTFDGHHSSEFGLMVVSDGNRYHQNLFSNFSDNIISVPGRNGSYYFGTQLQTRDFFIKCVYNEMTSHMFNKIRNWLYPNKVGWLIYDEAPYKKYKVKISNTTELSFIPFDEKQNIKNYTFQKEILKGELDIPFLSFEEFGYQNEEFFIPDVLKDEIIKQYDIDSGILPNKYNHENIYLPDENISEISASTNYNFWLYNAGNGIAVADFYFIIEKELIQDNDPFYFFNYENGESYIISSPKSIISNYEINFNSVYYYRIKLLGSKKEIWLDCLNEDKEKIGDSINIGGCFNHYYPKIYHNKPTEVMVMTQKKTEEHSEPLFFTYSYNEKNLGSSDSILEKHLYFEELQKYWSDYILLTPFQTFNVNNILNPSFEFVHQENLDEIENEEQLVYLIYPNKFYCNKRITNFKAEYKYTYI